MSAMAESEKQAKSHGNTNLNEEHMVNICIQTVCNAALRHLNGNIKMEDTLRPLRALTPKHTHTHKSCLFTGGV